MTINTAKALAKWQSGEALEAGRLLYEVIPTLQRPLWAASVLELCIDLIPNTPEINTILEIARTQRRWAESKEAFKSIRKLTLQADEEARNAKSIDYNLLYRTVLCLAENVAKVVFNATSSLAPYDRDSGWWVVDNLYLVAKIRNDPNFTSRAWFVASHTAIVGLE